MKLLGGLTRRLASTLALVALILSGCDANLDYRTISTHRLAFKQVDRSEQTDVDRAEHLVDDRGIPFLKIAGLAKQRHPAWIALYALAYAGEEVYDPRLVGLEDNAKFAASIWWLENNLKQDQSGLWLWRYWFDSTYNDISIKAPWSSAFAQATGIQAFLVAYRRSGDPKYLDLARRAAQPLFTPLRNGGFLFEANGDIWFEEIPHPIDNPGHILNGHMRVLLALRALADATGDVEIATWLKRGTDTLYRWLPLYDAGYWLRYDLNPRKQDLLFRFANPYGFANHPLAVDKITLRDPISAEEVAIDVGQEGDGSGPNRVAGTHWGAVEQIAGRSARRLLPAQLQDEPSILAPPHSYFYLSLPSAWTNNLRDQWYELILEYYDDTPANITIQQRAIAPGAAFRDMRDGDLQTTGAGYWRKWIVPVRATDLGYWVGKPYAEKHRAYLTEIARWDRRFQTWSHLARGYLNFAEVGLAPGLETNPTAGTIPTQTPKTPFFSLGSDGVVRQHIADENTKFDYPGNQFNPSSSPGTPVDSPYLVAMQLLHGAGMPGVQDSVVREGRVDRKSIRKEPAMRWLMDPRNSRAVDGAAIYLYSFDNVYNDVVTKSPWQSAFGQAYVLKTLMQAADTKLGGSNGLPGWIARAAAAFSIPLESGGVAVATRTGGVWFEEVPNATHVLNAHLVSVAELLEAARILGDQAVQAVADAGVDTLRENLHLFDTGYWLRYDQNPKKELLLQIDWIEGEEAPLIDEVLLQNLQTGRYVRLDIGGAEDSNGNVRIGGVEWRAAEKNDGRTVRRFENGYLLHEEAVPGGGRHNVYLTLALPDDQAGDAFDFSAHRLIIRYKDVARARMDVKVRTIHTGNRIDFAPVRGGVWPLVGDGQWKETVFTIRPQDLGWYKGADYQRYEVDQLLRIANLTNDWLFYQYAERQKHFLEMERRGIAAIESGDAKPATGALALELLSSSETYPGHGYENALDGEPNDDYVAGTELSRAYVVLGVNEPSKLVALRFHWESEGNRARSVVISAANQDFSAGAVLGRVRGLAGSVSSIPVRLNDSIKAIRIDFGDFFGQQRILLRQIGAVASVGEGIASGLSPDIADPHVPMFEADDPANPLSIMRLPITRRIGLLSERLSSGARSDHDKVLAFMRYIGEFRVGVASDATPDSAVEERVGACGTFSNTLLALAAAQGMKGRFVNLHNYPEGDGHTLTEIFVDGQWRLYDPTFGSYYVLEGRLDSRPLSFDEVQRFIKAGNKRLKQVVMVRRPGLEKFAGRDIFLRASPSGVIGVDRAMSYPLSLDLDDMPQLTEEDLGPRHQGADFLGAATTNQNHVWKLTGLVAGHEYVFSVLPKEIGGHFTPDDELKFRLRASLAGGRLLGASEHVFDFTGVTQPWRIRFKAFGPEVNLKITHPYRGPDFRYMTMKRYVIERVDGGKQ